MKRKNRERIRGLLLSAVLLAAGGSIAGCGGEFSADRRAVSEGAVSGSPVDKKEDEKTEENAIGTSERMSRFATDTNLYYCQENEDFDRTEYFQAALDGTGRTQLFTQEDGCCGLIGIAGGALYYLGDREGKLAICRAPIHKDAQGMDVLDKEAEEQLVSEGAQDVLYLDEEYLFYRGTADGELIKWDIRENKRAGASLDRQLDDEEEIQIVRLEGGYYALCEESGIFMQKPDGVTWNQISRNRVATIPMDYSLMVAQSERTLYYVPYDDDGWPKDVMKTEGENTSCIVPSRQLNKAVKKALGLPVTNELDEDSPVWSYGVTHLFCQDGRLYVQVEVYYDRDAKGSGATKYLLFYLDEGGKELRAEEELAKYMNASGQERSGRWIDESERDEWFNADEWGNFAHCICMRPGRAYLNLYDYEKDKGRLGCYEFRTGRFFWIRKGDAAFWELYREDGGRTEYENVYEKEPWNEYMEFEYSPVKEEDEDGSYYIFQVKK